jgi:AraC family transcriptional regulator
MDAPDLKLAWRYNHIARINRVLDHISRHLPDTLDLASLADVAHFSPWHFHRVFQAMTGETLADCVRRLRLEAAAQRLLAKPPLAALQVAMDVGFASAEVFSRAFRAHFGVTPTAWRAGAWREWAAAHQLELRKIHQAHDKANQDITPRLFEDKRHWSAGLVQTEKGFSMHVEIKAFPAMRLAYMRHTGPYGELGIAEVWARFAAWCGQNGLMNPRRKMYGISQDNPEITPADKCRYDACVEIEEAFRPDGEVGVQSFSGGRYACGRFTGKPGADVHAAWTRMFAEWLPQSGYQADDKPALELYEEDFVMEPDTGVFSCLLCVPVRAL